ncbi:TetR/AcrR family transcriptional regulator [Paeniglutamicibacter cryotolerans]|uniref:AcrR family transcriptional regulator n=1 Tax=Paeniglutamicibacter cryotolerans TaxID=670079 RepID=A0A839QPH5_9MICC|nr:TetR family transcriptional regulator [Paeniglutamicibacter cryotolerans]MBB2995132.1 AcrR family transcriptional regulator [Paeniglutamicibacter cryotolerans]
MALTREQLVDAAVGILSEFGLADLSMRRLARELDVQVGALYWHVKSKQDLLVDVAARLLGSIHPPVRGTDTEPRAAVAGMLTELRTVLLPVPDSAEVVQLAQTMQPAAIQPLTWLRDLLEDAGISAERSGWARHLLLNHLFGSVTVHQDRGSLQAVGSEAPGAPALDADAFAWGVEVVLDGLLGVRPGRASAERPRIGPPV